MMTAASTAFATLCRMCMMFIMMTPHCPEHRSSLCGVCAFVAHRDYQNMSHVLPRLNPASYPYANLGSQYFRAGGEFCKYHHYMMRRGSYSFPDIMHKMLGEPPKTVSGVFT